MAWIKLETHTFDKVEVYSIAQQLGIDADSVIGKCCRVWSWFDANTTDGVTKSVTKALLDRQCGVTGFCDAMISAGWMADDGEHIMLPYYDRHNSSSAKSRALGAKRQAKYKSNATADALGNATDDGQPLPKTSHRGEERREDIKDINSDELPITGDADDPSAGNKTKKENCPHEKIIDAYHRVLPMCPKIKDWTSARASQLRTRWSEDSARQNIEYWEQLFEYVKTCDFLVGKTNNPFIADLEWITKAGNFAKIREGKYENRGM